MDQHMETIDYKQYTVSFTKPPLFQRNRGGLVNVLYPLQRLCCTYTIYCLLSTVAINIKVLPGASTKKPPLARGNMNLTGLYREGWGSDRVCSCMALCLYGS